MSDALLYHNPRCSKSRKALQIIQNHNINIKVILYLTDKLTKAMLKEILDSSGLPVRDIIRSNEKEYKENNLDDLNLTCLLYTSPSPRDRQKSRMPSSA